MSWKPEVQPQLGDLIEIDRGYYQHWAIYVGNGDVVHLAPECEVAGAGLSSIRSVAADCAMVKKEPLRRVVGSDKYKINNKYDTRFPPLPVDEIICRAKAEVGTVMSYSVLGQNCEHFVTGLRYGTAVSDQVRDGAMLLGGTAIGTLAVVAVGTLIYKTFARRHQNE